MQFSKNKFYRKSEVIQSNLSYIHVFDNKQDVQIQPLFSTQYRKYDMIAIANSGSKCNFCNR